MKSDISEICSLVEEAFKDVTRPSDDRLVQGRSIEALQIQDFFRGKHWSEITLHALQHDYIGDGSACLWFMTPEAVIYYLPAYLLIACTEYYEADAISSELIYKFVRSATGEVNNVSIALEKLTNKQNIAIARFLKFISDNFESKEPTDYASNALQLRWGKYLHINR
jgi:hypothetical protein